MTRKGYNIIFPNPQFTTRPNQPIDNDSATKRQGIQYPHSRERRILSYAGRRMLLNCQKISIVKNQVQKLKKLPVDIWGRQYVPDSISCSSWWGSLVSWAPILMLIIGLLISIIIFCFLPSVPSGSSCSLSKPEYRCSLPNNPTTEQHFYLTDSEEMDPLIPIPSTLAPDIAPSQ